MGLNLEYEVGQTPLDEEEKVGLKIVSIATNAELNEFEQHNIEQAILWTFGKKINEQKLFSEQFVKELHKKMFGEVWKWAGQFRKTEKNIGIESWKIPTELKILLDDVRFWILHKTYSEDEIVIRFKHRIVSIHCFPNGNGRHSRLIADLISEKIFNKKPYTWGQASNLSDESNQRLMYLKALKNADKGDFNDLINFALS